MYGRWRIARESVKGITITRKSSFVFAHFRTHFTKTHNNKCHPHLDETRASPNPISFLVVRENEKLKNKSEHKNT